MSRVETGPVRFGDDWAGLFIRGDNAMHLSVLLGIAAEKMSDDPIHALQIESFAKLLRSCREPCEAVEIDFPASEEGSRAMDAVNDKIADMESYRSGDLSLDDVKRRSDARQPLPSPPDLDRKD